MNALLELLNYIYDRYPKVEELSKARLVKLVYLIDWKYSIENGEQYTEIKWYFNHYGPYVEDIIKVIRMRNDLFNVESYTNSYGTSSEKILRINKATIALNENILEASNYIIDNTWKLNWTEFISLVYSTFPVQNNSKYTYLDLKMEAIEFNARRVKTDKTIHQTH